MRHFNQNYFITQIHSPSWFAQVMKIERVKNDNGSRCFYDKGLCVLNSRRYQVEPFKALYMQKYFMVNPMECLRVIFSANYYGRIRQGVRL